MEFKDKFTLDGRLHPGPGVSPTKVKAVQSLLEKGMRGDRVAAAQFAESITTSDAIFNAAYLTQIQVLAQFDEQPRTWTQIAGIRSLPDFRPAVLQGMFGGFEGLERQGTAAGNGQVNPEGIAPEVAELETYPYATIGEVEAVYGQLRKHGFAVGFSWESRTNDAIGFFSSLPAEMRNVILDTEEWSVYQALINGTGAGSQLAGGTIYSGATVAPNAPISRDAIVRAIQELAERTVNGRRVQVNGGYNVIVPVGGAAAVNFMLNQQIVQRNDGSSDTFVFSVQDQFATGSVTVVESAYVSGTNWYLLPKPGAVRRPVLELGRLRGYEAPELRVYGATGSYVGGGAVSPFEGSFANDSIDLRVRYPHTGILWSDDYVVHSTGAGS
jgi:hypothetical protein